MNQVMDSLFHRKNLFPSLYLEFTGTRVNIELYSISPCLEFLESLMA